VAGADAIAKSWPRTGSYTQSHGEHVVSNSQPGCSACHDSDANGAAAAQGTYGDEAQHANGAVDLVFAQAMAEAQTVVYEGAAGVVYNDAVGNGAALGAETCASVRCHNGVTTPAFDLAAGVDIACSDCHGGAGTDPRPSDAAAGLHGAHANNDAVYTECDLCHGDATYSVSNARGASPYTESGGGGASPGGLHQNLVVNLYMAAGSGVYTDATARAGVNWTAAGGVDDGTCSATVCHNNDTSGGAGVSGAWSTAYTPADNCLMCHANGTDVVTDAAGADSVEDEWTTRAGRRRAGPGRGGSSDVGGAIFAQ
jgi:predicted CxxxxCH...CXXCH cytochrome family protein